MKISIIGAKRIGKDVFIEGLYDNHGKKILKGFKDFVKEKGNIDLQKISFGDVLKSEYVKEKESLEIKEISRTIHTLKENLLFKNRTKDNEDGPNLPHFYDLLKTIHKYQLNKKDVSNNFGVFNRTLFNIFEKESKKLDIKEEDLLRAIFPKIYIQDLLFDIIDLEENLFELIKDKEKYHLLIDFMKEDFRQDEYTIRKDLQYYGDYCKITNKNNFYFSEKLFKEKTYNENGDYINSDTRFITEYIDLILNDFFIIKLYNPSLEKLINFEKQHISERELSLNKNIKCFVLNIEGSIKDKQGILRQTQEEMDSSFEELYQKLLSFKGYSKKIKDFFIKTKSELKDIDHELFSLQKLYLSGENKKTYVEYIENSKLFENIKKEIKDIY